MTKESIGNFVWEPSLKVICPKHGTHPYTIHSAIEGHEGYWCQICWVESLGEPLPTIDDD